LAQRLKRPVRIAAAVLLVLVSLGAVAGGKTTIWSNVGPLSGAVVSFCVISLTVGYLAPRRLHLPPRQSIAVSLEIGLHNAMLAMGIALSPQLLNNTEMATPAAVYGFFAPVIALAFVFIVRRVDPAFKKEAEPATADSAAADKAAKIT
jgi:BASS family bile acid:Na+ symporter